MVSGNEAKPERGSWRAVWRALRVGHVDDPRHAALAWEAADRNVRSVWLIVFFAVVLLIQVVLLVVRILRGDEVFGTAAATFFLAAGLAVMWVARRRSKRYLELNDPPIG